MEQQQPFDSRPIPTPIPVAEGRRVRSAPDLAELAKELKRAERVVFDIQTVAPTSGGTAGGKGMPTVLRFHLAESSTRSQLFEVDIRDFDPMTSRGFNQRIATLLSPIANFFRASIPQKIVYGSEHRKRVNDFSRRVTGEATEVVDLESIVKVLRPDLASLALPIARSEILGVPGTSLSIDPGSKGRLQVVLKLSTELDRIVPLATPPAVPSEELLRVIIDREEKKLKLARQSGAANQYWVHRLRSVRLREAIEAKLIGRHETGSDEVTHTGEFGTARVRFSPKLTFNPELLRAKYPELIPALEPHVTKEKLLASFREEGLSRKQAEAVVETLYRPIGSGNPRATVSPDYQQLFKALPGAPVSPSWKIKPIVESRQKLQRLAKLLREEASFSIDTETWGPPGEPPDRDLCLIQIGIRPHGTTPGQVYLVRVKALEEELRSLGSDENPLEPLREVLESGSIRKVAHHKQFEEAQFAKYGIDLVNTDDTKFLVRELRPDLPSVTLRACCFEVMGVVLSKEQQLSDWNVERLSEEQIGYAALDAEYTLRLYDYVQSLRSQAEVPGEQTVDELFWQLITATGEAHRFGRLVGFSNEYWAHGVCAEACEEELKERLKKAILDDPVKTPIKYEDSFGSFSCTIPELREVDLERLQSEHPSIALKAIEWRVSEEVVRGALFERGLSEEEIEGEVKALTATVQEQVKVTVEPEFELFYR
jgi:hypothetical protein